MTRAPKGENRYIALIQKIFFDHYRKGTTEFSFERSELVKAAQLLKIDLPKNVGDVIYSISSPLKKVFVLRCAG